MRKEWEVYLEVPYGGAMEKWREVNAIAEGVDSTYGAAGTGFGIRDVQWYKRTRGEAVSLADQLSKAFVTFSGATVQVFERETK